MDTTWPDGSYSGMEPQCADCARGDGRYCRRPRHTNPRPLDNYLDQIGPVPSGVLKFYYALHGVIDLACVDALTLGAPIRNWDPICRIYGMRRSIDEENIDNAAYIPAWRLPAVSTDDVYIKYAERFGERPAARTRKCAPPLDEPDAFDRAIVTAIETGEPVRDWLSLETVRRITPPTQCEVHGVELRHGDAVAIASIGSDPHRYLRRQRAPHANTMVFEDWEFSDIALVKAPVSFCPGCRIEESQLVAHTGA